MARTFTLCKPQGATAHAPRRNKYSRVHIFCVYYYCIYNNARHHSDRPCRNDFVVCIVRTGRGALQPPTPQNAPNAAFPRLYKNNNIVNNCASVFVWRVMWLGGACFPIFRCDLVCRVLGGVLCMAVVGGTLVCVLVETASNAAFLLCWRRVRDDLDGYEIVATKSTENHTRAHRSH